MAVSAGNTILASDIVPKSGGTFTGTVGHNGVVTAGASNTYYWQAGGSGSYAWLDVTQGGSMKQNIVGYPNKIVISNLQTNQLNLNTSGAHVAEAGGGIGFVTSTGYRLIMQADGNLVLYNKSGSPIWYTNTVGK